MMTLYPETEIMPLMKMQESTGLLFLFQICIKKGNKL